MRRRTFLTRTVGGLVTATSLPRLAFGQAPAVVRSGAARPVIDYGTAAGDPGGGRAVI